MPRSPNGKGLHLLSALSRFESEPGRYFFFGDLLFSGLPGDELIDMDRGLDCDIDCESVFSDAVRSDALEALELADDLDRKRR